MDTKCKVIHAYIYRYQVSTLEARCQVVGTRYEVIGTRYEVIGTGYEVIGTGYEVVILYNYKIYCGTSQHTVTHTVLCRLIPPLSTPIGSLT